MLTIPDAVILLESMTVIAMGTVWADWSRRCAETITVSIPSGAGCDAAAGACWARDGAEMHKNADSDKSPMLGSLPFQVCN